MISEKLNPRPAMLAFRTCVGQAVSRPIVPSRLAVTLCMLLPAMCWSAGQVAAQGPEAESIAYRLVDGKTMHFDDPQKHAAHTEQVQKLGCEVSQGEHEGHGDVTYRCPKWKVLTVANDELVHQWEEWLKGAGFETLHGHAEEHGGEQAHAHDHAHEGAAHEEVTYRLANWVTVNTQQEGDAEELVAIAKGLGCEVEQAEQGGIAIRCVQKMHVELPSHEAAEFWQRWLTETGFEAQHED